MRNRLVAAISLLTFGGLSACFHDPYSVGSERLQPGDYNNGGKGILRRIIVTNSPTLPYDIWRAEPNGRFTHLHFTLTSPVKYPVESMKYKVTTSSKKCDDFTIRLYRDNDKVVPGIIVARFGDYEEPFGSAAHPLTAENYLRDRAELAELRRHAGSPTFYTSLPPIERLHQFEGEPHCV